MKINYQIQALKSLRKGIEDYSRRHGWQGPITNKIKNKNWKKKIERYKLDPTLNWYFAEIISLDDSKITFQIIEDKKVNFIGELNLKNIKWTIPKSKLIKDIHKIGDVIFIKKENNFWTLKQYPKVNGGIVVLDPYNGEVLALVGGFNFKTSEFNRELKQKDNQVLRLNQLFMLQL